MAEFLKELGRGERGAAEATLQRALIDAEVDQAKAKLAWDFLGKGGGTGLGTLVLPGLGTILGLFFGGMAADAYALSEAGRLTGWRKADR